LQTVFLTSLLEMAMAPIIGLHYFRQIKLPNPLVAPFVLLPWAPEIWLTEQNVALTFPKFFTCLLGYLLTFYFVPLDLAICFISLPFLCLISCVVPF